MNTLRASCIAIGVALFLGSASAHACSVVVTREPTPSEKRREAEELIDRATAIFDGKLSVLGVRQHLPSSEWNGFSKARIVSLSWLESETVAT